ALVIRVAVDVGSNGGRRAPGARLQRAAGPERAPNLSRGAQPPRSDRSDGSALRPLRTRAFLTGSSRRGGALLNGLSPQAASCQEGVQRERPRSCALKEC